MIGGGRIEGQPGGMDGLEGRGWGGIVVRDVAKCSSPPRREHSYLLPLTSPGGF